MDSAKSQRKNLRIFFSAGEPSGDIHGANLIRQLEAQWGAVETVGYGGPRMLEAGAQLHTDLTRLAVMWFGRVLMHLPTFWNLVSWADRYFRHHRPQAVVLIDYPGLNWWIARRAKVHRIPVFYYAPPQIWAWGQWRVQKMRRLVDHVLCGLPFEAQWLQQHGCRAVYVGHSFFDEVRLQKLDESFIRSLQQQGRWVTILPGSRMQEVLANLPSFLKTVELVHQAVPGVRFAVAAYRADQAEHARRLIGNGPLPIDVHVGRTPELISLAECCMACSGSVSLELLYHTKPTVILYRIGSFAYQVQKYFRKVKYITLVNLLASDNPLQQEDLRPFDPGQEDADRVLFPEYLTWEDKTAQMARHLVEWLTRPERRLARIRQLEHLRDRVGQPGASTHAASYILQQLGLLESQAPKQLPIPPPHFQAVFHSPAPGPVRSEEGDRSGTGGPFP